MAELLRKSLSMAGKQNVGTTQAAFLQTCGNVHRPPALKQMLAVNAVDTSELITWLSKGHLQKLCAGALGPPQPRLAHERPDGLLRVGRVDRDVIAKLLCARLPPAGPMRPVCDNCDIPPCQTAAVAPDMRGHNLRMPSLWLPWLDRLLCKACIKLPFVAKALTTVR